ncbi:MAG: response regulator [Alphaproteobacteria bacterium]|nr:response regulator [Alphaproteobacteria bacterium]MBV9372296.1 response regulator [Alphaproteobacteria bacterium]MBV9899588.1 response regulator [Alphaproteobacteria bacterium]
MPDKLVSVVDDDESLREAIVGLLRSMDYDARGFGSAEAFLAERDGGWSCVISDVQLPGLSGFDMVRRMRELGRGVPAIMITARAGDALEAEADAAGAFCVLRKPFESSALLDCVERALGA